MSKLNRMLSAIQMMYSRNGVSREELMQEFGVTERTIYRDIEDLRAAHFPIETDEKNGVYRIDRSIGVKALQFSDEEAIALLQCVTALDQESFPLSMELGMATDKLFACLPETKRKMIQNYLGISVVIIPEGYSVDKKIFNILNQGAVEKYKVKIDYQAADFQKVTERIVHPYGLIFKNRAWYLVAYCNIRKESRIFRVDRISKAIPLAENFSKPLNFCPHTFFNQSWSIGQGSMSTVKLRFHRDIAEQVKRAKYHSSQKTEICDDGSLLFEVNVRGNWEIARWVLGFGPMVEVLEPLELRNQVKDMIQAAQALYR